MPIRAGISTFKTLESEFLANLISGTPSVAKLTTDDDERHIKKIFLEQKTIFGTMTLKS